MTLIIRCLGGEALLNWKATVAFPWYDAEANTQHFPFKTMSMLIGLVVMLLVAYITDWMMRTGRMGTKALMIINNRYGREERAKSSYAFDNDSMTKETDVDSVKLK